MQGWVHAIVSLTRVAGPDECDRLLAQFLGGRSAWSSRADTGGAVAVAAADVRVGVDVEHVIGDQAVDDLFLRRHCTAAERRWVTSSPTPGLELTRLWVRKESISKALGRGLALGLAAFDARGDEIAGWQVRDVAAGPDHRAAVAWWGAATLTTSRSGPVELRE